MAEQELGPEENLESGEKVAASEESCKIIWSELDPDGHRHFLGLDCVSTEARDRAAGDIGKGAYRPRSVC